MFDTNPNVTNPSFCLDTNTYPKTNLEGLGSGKTYAKSGTDPGNCLGITFPFKLNAGSGADSGNGLSVTVPFKLNAGPGSELNVGGTVSGIDDKPGTGSIYLELDENPDTTLYDNSNINSTIDFTINYCAVTS